MSDQHWTDQDVTQILSNPGYCLAKVHPFFSREHPVVISEEQFIAAGVRIIEQHGAAFYIRKLLDNLRGNFKEENP